MSAILMTKKQQLMDKAKSLSDGVELIHKDRYEE
jgi:hypothetical protein